MECIELKTYENTEELTEIEVYNILWAIDCKITTLENWVKAGNEGSGYAKNDITILRSAYWKIRNQMVEREKNKLMEKEV